MKYYVVNGRGDVLQENGLFYGKGKFKAYKSLKFAKECAEIYKRQYRNSSTLIPIIVMDEDGTEVYRTEAAE